MKNSEVPEVYQPKRELLSELETLSERGLIDLYYGDESRVALKPNVPYGWQFVDEEVAMPSEKGSGLNCFALLKRNNQAVIETIERAIDSQFIFDKLEDFSIRIKKLTVVVLDNASVHRSRIIKGRIKIWQHRGLYIFYLPRFSPHLNIVEILWRKLKYEWLAPADYQDKGNLFYQIRLALKSVKHLSKSNVIC